MLPPLMFQIAEDRLVEYASPRTKEQLQLWLYLLFGLKVSSTAVCPKHEAPLDAAWATYSAESPVVVWKASRGLGGKTTLLGHLSLLELLDGMNVNVLGGSSQQSQRVHDIERDAWNYRIVQNGQEYSSPLKSFLSSEPTSYRTVTKYNNMLIALAASSKSVRGPHPHRLRMDEVDEMELPILDAAMGQAMSSMSKLGKYGKAQTTLSSTHQYPRGTMTEILNRANEQGWPIYEWCYRETHIDNNGWLTEEELNDKKASVTELMWRVEYDLQEPSPQGRVLSDNALALLFKRRIGVIQDRLGAYYEFEKPTKEGIYSVGGRLG